MISEYQSQSGVEWEYIKPGDLLQEPDSILNEDKWPARDTWFNIKSVYFNAILSPWFLEMEMSFSIYLLLLICKVIQRRDFNTNKEFKRDILTNSYNWLTKPKMQQFHGLNSHQSYVVSFTIKTGWMGILLIEKRNSEPQRGSEEDSEI